MHGGLFAKDDVTLDDIRQTDRNRQPPEEGIMCELLWSDPQPMRGRSPSKRGGFYIKLKHYKGVVLIKRETSCRRRNSIWPGRYNSFLGAQPSRLYNTQSRSQIGWLWGSSRWKMHNCILRSELLVIILQIGNLFLGIHSHSNSYMTVIPWVTKGLSLLWMERIWNPTLQLMRLW